MWPTNYYGVILCQILQGASARPFVINPSGQPIAAPRYLLLEVVDKTPVPVGGQAGATAPSRQVQGQVQQAVPVVGDLAGATAPSQHLQVQVQAQGQARVQQVVPVVGDPVSAMAPSQHLQVQVQAQGQVQTGHQAMPEGSSLIAAIP